MAGSLDEVRACLLLSRDGLTLGAHPGDGESRARAAWERMVLAGDPERGFLVMGEEVWAAARRGPYVGVIVASRDALPGVLLDRLDQVLRAAERDRERDGVFAGEQAPVVNEMPQSLRSPLHPIQEPTPELVPEPTPELVPVAASERAASIDPIVVGEATRIEIAGEADQEPETLDVADEGSSMEPPPARRRTLRKKVRKRRRARSTSVENGSRETATTPRREEPEVDPVALAREFAGLWGEREDRGR